MAIKNVVVSLEVEYLEAAAKERGVSRTKLVRAVMQKVIRDQLLDLSRTRIWSRRLERDIGDLAVRQLANSAKTAHSVAKPRVGPIRRSRRLKRLE